MYYFIDLYYHLYIKQWFKIRFCFIDVYIFLSIMQADLLNYIVVVIIIVDIVFSAINNLLRPTVLAHYSFIAHNKFMCSA